jgi:Putative beta-barrel porin-2, OmpL-like. bbp2
MKLSRLRPLTKTVYLGGALVGSASLGLAQDAAKLDKLEMENQALRKRLEALEAVAQKEGILPSGAVPAFPVKALSEVTLSGFVQASYFYNSTEPSDRVGNGYLWNTTHNSFSLNKVKVTLASPPAERSGEGWDAGYRVSLIWGEDSPVLNTGSPLAGFEGLREAYVELNVPLGTGLNVKAGQLISLLNWESGDGGAANPNFSQGYQWFFTGNGPAAGLQFGYTFTDWLDVKLRVQNGMYAGPIDSNNGKTVMGSIGLKPAKDLWVNLLGFGGEETKTLDVKGGSVLAGYDVSQQFHLGFEFDYFNFDPAVGTSADLWSVGGWAWYDFTPKIGLALRAEYLDDKDGGGIKGVSFPGATRVGSAITSPDPDGEIQSVALTLNWRPVPQIKIQPEIRYDHTSYTGGFDGKKDRVVFGAGATYLF